MTLDNLEHFLKLDDVSELEWKFNCFNGVICVVASINCVIDLVEENIKKIIKTVLKKSHISDEDTKLFFENHYLVDKNDL